jgi:hypothetical protein
MPIVEQELLTFPEHLSSHPVCMDFVLLDLSFCVVFCRSLFVLFLVVIIMSVRLRYTDSDCPFGIFKQGNYFSHSNEGRHIVLVWFCPPLPLLLLLLSEACPDHNFFVFPDRPIIFGMWVHDHKAMCLHTYWPSWDLHLWPQGLIIVF